MKEINFDLDLAYFNNSLQNSENKLFYTNHNLFVRLVKVLYVPSADDLREDLHIELLNKFIDKN